MESKISKDQLLENLPDYVSGKLDDEALVKAIEVEIAGNDNFRREHEEMKKTFAFLNAAEFVSPPESYFSNLSVRINQKVDQTSEPSLWERLGLFWKILIPALSLILMGIILYNIYGNKKEQTMTQNDKTIEQKVVVEKNVPVEKTDEKIVDKIVDNKEPAEDFAATNEGKNIRIKKRIQKEKVNIADTLPNIGTFELSELIATNIGDPDDEDVSEEADVLYQEEGEENLEEEFMELTPEQQEEILKVLSDKQI